MSEPDFEAEARDVIDRVVDTQGGFGLMSAIASALRRIDAAGSARGVEDSAKVAEGAYQVRDGIKSEATSREAAPLIRCLSSMSEKE